MTDNRNTSSRIMVLDDSQVCKPVSMSVMMGCQPGGVLPVQSGLWMYQLAYQQAVAATRSWRWHRRMQPGLN